MQFLHHLRSEFRFLYQNHIRGDRFIELNGKFKAKNNIWKNQIISVPDTNICSRYRFSALINCQNEKANLSENIFWGNQTIMGEFLPDHTIFRLNETSFGTVWTEKWKHTQTKLFQKELNQKYCNIDWEIWSINLSHIFIRKHYHTTTSKKIFFSCLRPVLCRNCHFTLYELHGHGRG